ncbi:MAG: hypothetical protein K6A73_02080 [Bacteroidales bacterium]|nr:hypothetical protein [Bacteroidales bacterium]
MKLPAPKEEMIERFKLMGEIYCTCYELCDGDGPTDLEGFNIEYDVEICEELERDPDEEPLLLTLSDEIHEVPFTDIEFGEPDGQLLIGVKGEKYAYQIPAEMMPSESLRRISDLLKTYAEALKN